MSDFYLVDPQGWKYDLQSVRSFPDFQDAYITLMIPDLPDLLGLHGLFPTLRRSMVRASHTDTNVPLILLSITVGTIGRGVSSLRHLKDSLPFLGP